MENAGNNILPHTSRTIYTTCTPRTREKKRFSLGITTEPPDDDHDPIDILSELLSQTWNIYGVSTLFNFYQDEVHLKQYAKRLREEVAGTLAQQDVAYTAKFLVMENITVRPHPVDPPPIKVEVYAKNISSGENSIEKCIYKGIFLSWRTIQNELTIANCIRLPLLLCRGTQSGMRTVHNIIGRMFDCMAIALPAQEDDLIWLVAIVITPTNKEEQPKSTDEIHMQYRIPELPDTDTIAVKFHVLDLIRILTVIIKDQSDEASNEISFNLDHIEKFRDVLYTHMLETAGLQLGLCTLHKIQLPALTIMGNRIKVTKLDTMNRVLLYLNEKALDTFHTLNFEV
ncbi:uncharacterized protein LOC143369006 isoform X1 [Andrena cerasifolii]|uniref:uncharacterized protein LOC143369006 isoform X1 n=1 Tax=Andrena cerasifolii TaxID=2819439 RepID=UPI004037956F